MPEFEQLIREAGREQRRVLVRFESAPGTQYERELEPYSIQDGVLHAFSYLRNEFRTLELGTISRVEISPRSFTPRRAIEL